MKVDRKLGGIGTVDAEVVPDRGPVLAVFRAGQQLVDEFWPFVRVPAFEESHGLIKCGNSTDDVDVDPPAKLAVAGLRGRRNHLGVDTFVDLPVDRFGDTDVEKALDGPPI